MVLRRSDLTLDPAQRTPGLRVDLCDGIEQGTADEGRAKEGLAVSIIRIASISAHDATGWWTAAGALAVAGTADLEDSGGGKEPIEPRNQLVARKVVAGGCGRVDDHRQFTPHLITPHLARAAGTKRNLRHRAFTGIFGKLESLATIRGLNATDPAFLISRPVGHQWSSPSLTERSRRALVMTETELKVMAALAIIGLRSRPKTGYSIPAARGTPSVL